MFYERGFDGATVADVAERVGLLAGSLYNYISAKEDLLVAVVEKFHSGAGPIMEEVERTSVRPLEKIRVFAAGHISYTMAHVVPAAVLQHDYWRLPDEARAEASAFRDRAEAMVRGWIREGQKEGSIRGSVDPSLASLAVFGMLNSVYRWYRPAGPASADMIADQFTALIVGALTTGSGLSGVLVTGLNDQVMSD